MQIKLLGGKSAFHDEVWSVDFINFEKFGSFYYEEAVEQRQKNTFETVLVHRRKMGEHIEH